jgi:S-adenosylmethionine hydrolase
MKGTILSIAPDANIIDITNEVPAQDVMGAAHILAGVVPFFPVGTVHLVVVDPGVGTDRRGIALSINGQHFVGPDNGLFSLLVNRRQPDRIVELDCEQFWLTQAPSSTFHGRDIFAPVAAHLATGRSLDDVGSRIDDLSTMHWALPITDRQGIQGWVVHVDAFGNCITNISRETFEAIRERRAFKCYAGNAILDRMANTYAQAQPGDDLMLFNSEDALELAINRGNASEMLDIRKGTSVNIVFLDDRQTDGDV